MNKENKAKTSPDGEAFVVRFTQEGIAGLQRAILFGFLLSFIGAAIAIFGSAETLDEKIVKWLCVVLSPILLVTMTVLMGRLLRWKRREALIVSSEGLEIGFGPRETHVLPWQDLKEVAIGVDQPYGQSTPMLRVEANSWSYRPNGDDDAWPLCSSLAGKRPLSIGMMLLDKTGDDILIAVQRLCPVRYRPFLRVQEGKSVALDGKRILETRNGLLVTVDDYRHVFRKGPFGVWDTSGFSFSPADTSCGFCCDGTGFVTTGATGLMGYSAEIQWRSVGEFLIEVRAADEDGWFPLQYDFEDSEGKVKIYFWEPEDISDNQFDWFVALAGEHMPYSGPCRDDRLPSDND